MRLVPPSSSDDDRKKRPRPLSSIPLAIGSGNRCLRVPGSCLADTEARQFTARVNAKRDSDDLLLKGGSFLFLLLMVMTVVWFGRRRAGIRRIIFPRPWLGVVVMLLALGISPWFEHLSLPEASLSILLATAGLIALRLTRVCTNAVKVSPVDHSSGDGPAGSALPEEAGGANGWWMAILQPPRDGGAGRWTRSTAPERRGEQLPARRKAVATRTSQKENDEIAAPAVEPAEGVDNNDDRSITEDWLARSPRSPLMRSPAKRPRTKPGVRAQKRSSTAATAAATTGAGAGAGDGMVKAAATRAGNAKRGGGGAKRHDDDKRRESRVGARSI